MTKRPSLVGSARAAIHATTGKAPPETDPQAVAPTTPRPARRQREKPAAETIRIPVELEISAPSAGNGSAVPDAPLVIGPAAVFEELISFGGERLRRAVALGQALGQSRSPAEAIAAQAVFARETAAHYTAESYKLMRLASTFWT